MSGEQVGGETSEVVVVLVEQWWWYCFGGKGGAGVVLWFGQTQGLTGLIL